MSTIILGCGIIGLTSAIRLLEAQPTTPTHILASRLPTDPIHPEYASNCAGAHHLSFAADDDERQSRWDRRTFDVMQAELDQVGESTGLMSLRQTEYFDGQEKHLKFLEGYPEFRITPPSELPGFATHSVSFRSITMSPLTYLTHLTTRFLELGGHIHRAHIPSLASLPQTCRSLDIPIPRNVIVATGIGSLSLTRVEDSTVFPTTGQVVIIHAPWIKTGWTRQEGSLAGGEGGRRNYVIPRANGEVVLGGTREVGNWSPEPNPETTIAILTGVIELYPSILSDHPTTPLPPTASLSSKLSLLRTLITRDVVGYRPSRSSGPRVERGPDLEGHVKVVYNYGHGGAGWQACWGAAEETRDLVLAAGLGRKDKPRVKAKL